MSHKTKGLIFILFVLILGAIAGISCIGMTISSAAMFGSFFLTATLFVGFLLGMAGSQQHIRAQAEQTENLRKKMMENIQAQAEHLELIVETLSKAVSAKVAIRMIEELSLCKKNDEQIDAALKRAEHIVNEEVKSLHEEMKKHV